MRIPPDLQERFDERVAIMVVENCPLEKARVEAETEIAAIMAARQRAATIREAQRLDEHHRARRNRLEA